MNINPNSNQSALIIVIGQNSTACEGGRTLFYSGARLEIGKDWILISELDWELWIIWWLTGLN